MTGKSTVCNIYSAATGPRLEKMWPHIWTEFWQDLFPDAHMSKAAKSTTKWRFLSLKKVISKREVMTSLWAIFIVLLIHWPQTTGDPMWSRWMRKEDTFLRAFTSKHLWNLNLLMGAKEWGHGPAWMNPQLTIKQMDCSNLQAKKLIFFALMKSTPKGGYVEL